MRVFLRLQILQQPFRALIPLVISVTLTTVSVEAQSQPNPENVDHAGIISAWDAQSLDRGRQLFQIACAPCHGTDGIHTINPQSRPFAVDRFQNGPDPFSLFRTMTGGFKNMPSQGWMTPAQRYDVIQYIRETFLKTLNPSQYFAVDRTYLDSLPKFDPHHTRTNAETGNARDYGPALESQLGTDYEDALTIRLSGDVTVSYDLHRLRLAGAWQGGFLDLSRTGHTEQRGEGQPMREGTLLRGLQHWYWAFNGQFDYPTNDLLPRGPLPEKWMRYRGHYIHGWQTVLAYDVDGREILELPGADKGADVLTLSHVLRIGPGRKPLRLCVGQPARPSATGEGLLAKGATVPVGLKGSAEDHLITTGDVSPSGPSAFIAAGVVGQIEGLTWEIDDQHRMVLNLPADTAPRVIGVYCFAGAGETQQRSIERYVAEARKLSPPDPETLTHGGLQLWPASIEVTGTLGDPAGAYALDTIPLPSQNPYRAWLRTSALAFFPDGRAVVTTYGGDVWIVSGLDAGLEHVKWSRFAAGLYEPFGAQVIDGLIYVTCRNGIVRLHDLNGNGAADYYETFYADTDVSTFFHAFNFDLQVDRQGGLYYVKPGEYTNYKLPGAVIEVSPEGRNARAYCTGFRVPNGMGLLPDGRLTVSDNQGNWMPASKINLVRRGGFYGYVPNLEGGGAFGDHWAPDGGRIDPKAVPVPATFDQPIIWMPQEFDNSSGGQVWAGDARFGPLSSRLLHTSFGKGWMYYLMMHDVGTVSQAAIVKLPFQFDAGIMRARFNPADGQVYATGLSGWQGPADGKDGCLQRLRYTGRPIKLLDDVEVRSGGLGLRFNFELSPAGARDPASYHLEQWNYLWTSNYGSDQYSVEHPGQKGHDQLMIQEVQLAPDRRSVVLVIPGLRPVNQVEIRLDLAAADGERFHELAYLTINAIPAKNP
jgi:glucose/arabinose dehydrogenase/mono/diheme cytochrome c family protein